jgi:regulator of replication initiation timing
MGGESDFNGYEDLVRIYDIAGDSWSSGAAMPVATNAGSVVVDGNFAYLIGGEDDSGFVTDAVYRYNISDDSWDTMASMPNAACAQGAVLGDGIIYVFGGADGASNTPGTTYSFAAYYDIEHDFWGILNDMITPRAWVGAAVLGDKIYAIGGNDASEIFSTVESTWILSHFEKQITLLQNQLTQANNDIAALEGDIAALEGDVSDLTDANAALRLKIVNLSAQLNQTTDDLNAALEAANNNANNAKTAADSANMIGMIGIIIGIVAILIAVIALVMKKKAPIQQMQPMPPMPPQ